jgi:hypothetical protein
MTGSAKPRVVASWQTGDRDALVGQKACGLLNLPETWTPPFVAWLREPDGDLEDALRAALFELIRRANGARVIVRSDGPAETAHPGAGTSIVLAANTSALDEALGDRDLARCALAQVAVEPAVAGLMSNERRLSVRADAWTLEGELALARPERRPLPTLVPAQRDLQALTPKDAADVLAVVGAQLAADGARRRVEWLWDGSRVWIVQADRLDARPPATRPPGPIAGPAPSLGQLAGDKSFRGCKIGRWRVFERLGWVRPEIHLITGDHWRHDAHHVAEELRRRMSGDPPGPWVVRTDVLEGVGVEHLLLPASPACDNPERLVGYMVETAERMADARLADEQWAFLVAPLYPCQASAWAEASPRHDLVAVDALWGFPDGLLHLPHDSYQVNATGEVSATVRFKPACVIAEHDRWSTQKLLAPYDWETPLDDDELQAIAALTRGLAAEVHHAVQLMILARVGGQRGAGGLLPFHFTLRTERGKPAHRPGGRDPHEAVLTGPDDLDTLDERQPPAVLRVDPKPEALRDAAFLRRVGRWASERRVPIIFAGSVLGHAFHLLAQDGAAVVQLADDERTQQLEDVEWQTVVVAYAQGLERVRTVPRQFARAAAATTLARLAPGATTGPRAVRALAALVDEQPAERNTGSPFDRLGRVEVEGPLGTWAAGSVPLFMDERPGTPPAGTLREASFELPLGDGEVSQCVDVPGGRVSVSSSRPGRAIVTVTPNPAA